MRPSAPIASDVRASRPVSRGRTRWMVIGSVPAAFAGAYLLHLMGHAKSAQHNIETALGALSIPHGKGGVGAAIAYLAQETAS